MTSLQKAIKYLAIAFAIFLIVSIFSGIAGVIGIFGGIFDRDSATGDLRTYSVSDNITDLKVTINAADFQIKGADTFYVESNLSKLTVDERNGQLIIVDKMKAATTYNDASLTLYIPQDYIFQKVELTTGAGRLSADVISAQKLHLELGAGEVNIGQLNADNKASISGGAGAFSVSSGTLHNLELDMGVGEMNLTAALRGSSELDYGIGEANLTLLGSKEDYRLELEKGIGDIRVDGQTVAHESVYGNGIHTVEINGGIGNIVVNFQ